MSIYKHLTCPFTYSVTIQMKVFQQYLSVAQFVFFCHIFQHKTGIVLGRQFWVLLVDYFSLAVRTRPSRVRTLQLSLPDNPVCILDENVFGRSLDACGMFWTVWPHSQRSILRNSFLN